MILLIVLIYMYYAYYNKTIKDENADPNIYFMNFDETAAFLQNDKDHYASNLTAIDLYARKVKTHQEYKDNIMSISISFTPDEKNMLITCSKNADIFFRTSNFEGLSYSKYLNGNDIATIKWIFAKTYKNNNKEYEEGLPHTRENVIFLSNYVLKYNEHDLTNTLIHEKVHIYQRYNPDLFDAIIASMNYAALDVDRMPYKKYIRSNPDTNKKVYYDVTTNKEMVCLYRNDKPNGINDIVMNNFSLEHPYEKIAYDVANHYYKKNVDKYIKL